MIGRRPPVERGRVHGERIQPEGVHPGRGSRWSVSRWSVSRWSGSRGPQATRAPSGGSRRWFLWELRPYFAQLSGLLVVGSLAGIVMNVAAVLPSILLGRAVNVVLEVEQHHATSARVGWAALAFLGATALTDGPRIAKRYWLGLARARFRATVRSDVLRGVLGQPIVEAALYPVGDVMARAVGDVEVLGIGVGEVMAETWDTLLFSVSMVVTMFVYSPVLAAVALAPVPPALWIARRTGRMVAKRTSAARESESELTGALREQIGGLRLLRLAGRTGAATLQIESLADRQAKAELAAIRLDEALGAVYGVLLSSGVVFVVWFGAQRVLAASMSVGSLVAFLALFTRFVKRAPRIPQMVNRVQAAGAAYRRLAPLLAPPLPAKSEPRWSSFRSTHVPGLPPRRPERTALREGGAVAVRFKGAGFTYPGSATPALSEVDLEVAPGALVAVTGPVGSGKSALARLAAGLYPPGSGTVEIAGRPAATLDPEERAETVGYLGQEPQVFSGTVVENVTMWPEPAGPPSGPHAGEGRSPSDGGDFGLGSSLGPTGERAVAVAAFEADLAAMPRGPATQIGELGVRVSGGQRQRIALARALAAAGRTPRLLVLDDPFSAVDVRTEAAIIAGLREAFGPAAPEEQRATIIVCSHRLAAFAHADVVVVLEAGRLTETGTHAELLAAGGLYARIVRAQARIESLSEAFEDSNGQDVVGANTLAGGGPM